MGGQSQTGFVGPCFGQHVLQREGSDFLPQGIPVGRAVECLFQFGELHGGMQGIVFPDPNIQLRTLLGDLRFEFLSRVCHTLVVTLVSGCLGMCFVRFVPGLFLLFFQGT